VSNRAGHSDTNITMATYAHVLDELHSSEVEKTKDVLLRLAQ